MSLTSRLKDTASVVGGVDKKEVWTDSNRRLSDLLLQNVKHLKPIEASYQDALSGLLSGNKFTGGRHLLTSGLAGFSSALAAYVKYAVDDVEPLVVVSIQQESNSSSSSPTQQSTNGQLQSEVLPQFQAYYFCAHNKENVHLISSSLPRFNKCYETSKIFTRQLSSQCQEFS